MFYCGSGRAGRVHPCRESCVSMCEAQLWFGLLGSDGDSVASHREKTCPEVSRPGRALETVSLANPRPAGPGAKVGFVRVCAEDDGNEWIKNTCFSVNDWITNEILFWFSVYSDRCQNDLLLENYGWSISMMLSAPRGLNNNTTYIKLLNLLCVVA